MRGSHVSRATMQADDSSFVDCLPYTGRERTGVAKGVSVPRKEQAQHVR